MEIIFLYIFILTFWYNINASIVMISLMLIFLIIKRVTQHKKIIILNKDIGFIFVIILASLSMQYNPLQINYIAKLVIYPFLISLYIQNTNLNEAKIKTALNLVIFISVFIIFYMFFQEKFGQFNFSLDYILSRSRSGGYYYLNQYNKIGPTVISSLQAFSMLLILNMMLNTKHYVNLKNWIYPFVFLILLLLNIISTGRGSWIALIFSSSFVILRFRKMKLKYLIISIVIILIIFFFIIPIIAVYQPDSFMSRINSTLTPSGDSGLLSRLHFFSIGISEFNENIFGFGYNYFLEKYGYSVHNEWLAQLVGVGILGLLAYIFLFILLIRDFNKTVSSRDFFYTLFYSNIILFFIISLTENISYSSNNTLYVLLWIVFSLSYVGSKNSKPISNYDYPK